MKRHAIIVFSAVSLLVCVGASLLWIGWVLLSVQPASAYQSIDMETVGSFHFDELKGTVNDIPVDVRKLDGRRVSVTGWMIPMDGAERIRQFAIVPHIDAFNGTPTRITQTIVAQVPAGEATCYLSGEVRVDGTLHISVATTDGSPFSLFAMDVDRVAPAPPRVRFPWPWIAGGGASALILLISLVVVKLRIVTLREKNDMCPRCGYDLRATPERCPECGTVRGKAEGWGDCVR